MTFHDGIDSMVELEFDILEELASRPNTDGGLRVAVCVGDGDGPYWQAGDRTSEVFENALGRLVERGLIVREELEEGYQAEDGPCGWDIAERAAYIEDKPAMETR